MTEFNQFIAEWETFYLLVGTAAATLIGLLFVGIDSDLDRGFAEESAKPSRAGGRDRYADGLGGRECVDDLDPGE